MFLEKKSVNSIIMLISLVGLFTSLFYAGLTPFNLLFWSIIGFTFVFAACLYLFGLDPWDQISFFRSRLLTVKNQEATEKRRRSNKMPPIRGG